jgi:dUTP pyrophosphatase
MIVKIKKLVENAVIPSYAKDGDAGMDLTATSKWFEGSNVCYGTGLAMEIPKGFVGLVFPRSSIAKQELLLSNAVGVIDSGYRGEIMAKFKTVNGGAYMYEVGDRICQIIIMPYPKIEFEEVEELAKTERGDGGYGSSGK